VRCAGTQDWALLAVVGPYARLIWAEWCAKALGRIPFIAVAAMCEGRGQSLVKYFFNVVLAEAHVAESHGQQKQLVFHAPIGC